jgi:hypothetical protein
MSLEPLVGHPALYDWTVVDDLQFYPRRMLTCCNYSDEVLPRGVCVQIWASAEVIRPLSPIPLQVERAQEDSTTFVGIVAEPIQPGNFGPVIASGLVIVTEAAEGDIVAPGYALITQTPTLDDPLSVGPDGILKRGGTAPVGRVVCHRNKVGESGFHIVAAIKGIIPADHGG